MEDRHFKTEGDLIYPDMHMLTWGPFYFHSYEKAKEKMDEIMKWVIDWVNEKDKTLDVKPEKIVETSDGRMKAFGIKAWKDNQTLEDCKVVISVEDIFYED